jgi:hypothetical protein
MKLSKLTYILFLLFSFSSIAKEKSSTSIVLIDSINVDVNNTIQIDSSIFDKLIVSIDSLPEKDSLEVKLQSLELSIAKYEDKLKKWTLIWFPLFALLANLIPFALTVYIQARKGREERELIEERARTERMQVQERWENDQEIARIDSKIEADQETLKELFDYLEGETGTNAKAIYFGLAIKSLLLIEDYPESFQNFSNATMLLLTNFFSIDAEFYEKKHHTYLHAQLLRNIEEFKSATKDLDDTNYRLMLQRYEIAFKRADYAGMGAFLESWILHLKGNKEKFEEIIQRDTNRAMLWLNQIDSLQTVHDLFEENSERRSDIEVLINRVFSIDDFYRIIFIEKGQ